MPTSENCAQLGGGVRALRIGLQTSLHSTLGSKNNETLSEDKDYATKILPLYQAQGEEMGVGLESRKVVVKWEHRCISAVRDYPPIPGKYNP